MKKNIINSKYDFNITRTGLSKESDEYLERAKAVNNLEKILASRNISSVFDCSLASNYNKKFVATLTGTNYGLILNFVNNRYENYVFHTYVLNKKLENILNINLKNETMISKYNHNSEHKFNKNINGIAVLPNQNKLKNVDFLKLNKFMENHNNFIKIHPVISEPFVNHLERKYGAERMIKKYYDLTEIIKKSEIVAVTSNTESMIPVSLYNKKSFLLGTDNLTKDGTQSTYTLFYLATKHKVPIQDIFNADLTSLIPWSLVYDENYIHSKIDKIMSIYDEWRNSVYNCSF